MDDRDIKIAGDRPSKDVERHILKLSMGIDSVSVRLGTALGEKIAERFVAALLEKGPGVGQGSEDMLLQRQILLSFAALSGFERFCATADYVTVAKSSFLSYIKTHHPELYNGATDNGALSFYYLAFRRGGDVERSIGQTFAMLCSHDGDPVYQELGEALYCWFTSVVRREEAKISNPEESNDEHTK